MPFALVQFNTLQPATNHAHLCQHGRACADQGSTKEAAAASHQPLPRWNGAFAIGHAAKIQGTWGIQKPLQDLCRCMCEVKKQACSCRTDCACGAAHCQVHLEFFTQTAWNKHKQFYHFLNLPEPEGENTLCSPVLPLLAWPKSLLAPATGNQRSTAQARLHWEVAVSADCALVPGDGNIASPQVLCVHALVC